MAKTDKYSIDDFKTDFPDEEACFELIFLSSHSKECSCGGVYSYLQDYRKYQCSKCRFQISPTARTIFAKSSTSLLLWFHAIFIFSNAKSGISAKEMERQLGVTYKCAYRILSKIRGSLKQDSSLLKGIVELDIAYFGSRKNQTNFTVGVERSGRIKTKVGNLSGQNMRDFLNASVAKRSRLMTDKAAIYSGLTGYKWESVNHSKGEYSRGKVHINTAEAFFGHVKRSINGTFKTVSKKYLQSYLDSFAFHWNTSNNDRARFWNLLGLLSKLSI